MINVHVDIDNIWIWNEESGHKTSYSQDLMFDQAMPVLLDLFDKYSIKSTFFVVGKDLRSMSCRQFCMDAISKGHELANHTFNHPQSIHKLSFKEKEAEIKGCDELISNTTGQKPVGFRAPGYYVDQDIVDILTDCNYLYDTTVLPGLAVLAMRAIRDLGNSFSKEKTFGRGRYLTASRGVRKVYDRNKNQFIYEIPVSVAPFLRTPIHSTYLYLFGFSYFKAVLPILNAFSKEIIYLFHSVDALSIPRDRILERSVVPLRWSLEKRLGLVNSILNSLASLRRPIITTKQMIAELEKQEIPATTFLSN